MELRKLISEELNSFLDEVKYINPKDYENYEPIKDSDTIRVYHGFYSFNDVQKVLSTGLSGKEKARRIYSYESGNNPNGLFVSVDFKVASKFATSGVVIEFSTKVSDLEAPIWVDGRSYFVQGEYTKSFKDLDEREQQRLINRQKAGESAYDFISKSDRPELAETIFDNPEKQALYVGDLNPNMIKYVWYNEQLHKNRRLDGEWKRLRRKDFIKRLNVDTTDKHRIGYKANDDFNFDELVDNIYDGDYNSRDLKDFVKNTLQDTYRMRNIGFFPKQIKQIQDLTKKGYFDKYLGESVNNINENFNYNKLKYRFEQTLKNNGVGDFGKLNVDKLTKYTYDDGIRNILMELDVIDNEYDEENDGEYDKIVEEKFKNNKFYKIWVNYVRNMDRRRKGSSLDFYSFINYITYRNVYSFNDDENHIFGMYENGFFKPSHFSSKTIFGGTKLIKEILHYNNIIFLVTPDLKDMLIKLGAYTKDDLILPMFFRGELVYKNLILTSPKLLVEIMFEIDDIEELLNKKYEDIYGKFYDYDDQYKYKKRDYINKNMGRNRKPLTEELHNVDDDVNLLYNKFFKSDIDDVKRSGFVFKFLFKEYKTDTSILKNPKSIKAHKLNPCEILINHEGNYYYPDKHIIDLSINKGAVDYIIGEYGGNLKKAVDDTYEDYKDPLINEFEEHKIKGSIHHELTHWIDDTLYGSHINKYIKKNKVDKKYDKVTVNTLPFEINAQIHAIKQIKNKNEDKWDNLTFGNLIKISPSLFNIYISLSYDDKNEWIKKLKKRMYREGLLGKKMFN